MSEWELQRDEFKRTADAHFRSKSYPAAIAAYQSALDLDPTNYILLSNQSAAHLANGEKSKAFHAAQRCVECAPKDWVKGQTRLGAALAALGRYSEAKKVYHLVLSQLDSENVVAQQGLEDCRAKEQQQQQQQQQQQPKETPPPSGEDLLDDFFSEVETAIQQRPVPTEASPEEEDSKKRIKIHLNDLGTSASQIDRLLQTNYEWKNLNPFYVLDMPHTIEDDSLITARYRALSLLVHPDKNIHDVIRAKTAFEQVKKAMEHINDIDKRRHVRQLVEQGHKQGRSDWEQEMAKRTTPLTDAQQLDGLEAAQRKATMKLFASIEVKRRDVERRKRKYEQRERAQEDEEVEREKNIRDHDKKWRETGRVEKRVGNWRDFQKKQG